MKDWGDWTNMAGLALQRARLYELLVTVFGRVPDSAMTGWLQGPGFRDIIRAFREAASKKLNRSAAMMDAYISHLAGRDERQVIEELSVERTLLIRAPGENNFKAPYEGLYKKEKSEGGAALAVKTFYRRAGLLPDETINESPDYLCLELDFMRQLCRREAGQWEAGQIPAETIRLEHEFLKEHLGSWIEEYCDVAAGKAKTDFYRGCLGLMKVTVAIDREILGELAAKVKNMGGS